MNDKIMKKITVFTGAGISAESGIPTFRDINNGLWYNYPVNEVATIEGWNSNKEKVIDFHNLIREKIKNTKPNIAHIKIAELENDFDVTIVTQNIDNLHEKAGSTKVFHIHGELNKSRSTMNPNLVYDQVVSLKIGDKCELGSQLKPDTVLFGEYPRFMEEAYHAVSTCDILIIIGTSLSIVYVPYIISSVKDGVPIYFIDPNPSRELDNFLNIDYIEKSAVDGMNYLFNKLKTENESN